MLEELSNNIAAFVGILTALIFFVSRSYPNLLARIAVVKDERRILLPTLILLVSPFASTYLVSHQDSIRYLISCLIFFLGQFLERRKYQKELKLKEDGLFEKISHQLGDFGNKIQNHRVKSDSEIQSDYERDVDNNDYDGARRRNFENIQEICSFAKELKLNNTLREIGFMNQFQYTDYQVLDTKQPEKQDVFTIAWNVSFHLNEMERYYDTLQTEIVNGEYGNYSFDNLSDTINSICESIKEFADAYRKYIYN